jgi:hypothetical protein
MENSRQPNRWRAAILHRFVQLVNRQITQNLEEALEL